MRIGTYIHHTEFEELHKRLFEDEVSSKEKLQLIQRFGAEILEAIESEKMQPNWHCKKCLTDYGAVTEMTSCPKCFTYTMEYIGPPRIGYEIKARKITKLKEAGRSEMSGGSGQQTHPMFKKCPDDHFQEFKEMRKEYFMHWCHECEDWKARNKKIQVPVA